MEHGNVEHAVPTRTILVVEDNADNMYVLDHVLTRNGYVVQQAMRGDEALRLMHEHTPDLVLMDMQMPGMDGYSVVRALRAQPTLCMVPVIAVTASSMPGDREAILAAGCTDYVAKPIDTHAVLRLIHHYLGGGPHGADLNR